MSNMINPSLRTVLRDWIVLVVDDQPDNLMIAKAALEFQGATVIVAGNGEEGMLLLQAQQPTTILLDLSMPKMDGWEMLRRIRSRPETAKTPVIALTAHAMTGDRERVMAAGFNGYIAKPFDVMTLPIQIQQIMSQMIISSQQTATTGTH
jgi:two-component system cell cycle response regulator DivK